VFPGKWLSAFAVGAAILVISGCGGGGGSSTGMQELSKAEWITRADAICAQTEELKAPALKEVRVVESELKSESQLETLGEILMKVVGEVRPAYSEVHQLPEPEEAGQMVRHLLSLYRASILTAEGGAEALEARDLAGYENLEAKQQTISASGVTGNVCRFP
jgi:hypothetical protein